MSHSVYVILYFFFFLFFFSAITIVVQVNSFTIQLLTKMAIHTIVILGIFRFQQEKRAAGTRVPFEWKISFISSVCDCVLLSLAWPGFVHSISLSLSYSHCSYLLADCLRCFDCKIKLKGTLIPPKCLKHINFQSSNIFVKYLQQKHLYMCADRYRWTCVINSFVCITFPQQIKIRHSFGVIRYGRC